MSSILSPESPELNEQDFALLAHYAKHLGRAPKATQLARQSGERQSRRKGHGMEMLELRIYQPSDDLRHIDWRVTARTGQAHTRLYAEENEHQRMLLLDLSSQAYFGTRHTFISTRFLQLAGLISWRAHQQGDSLSYRLLYGDESSSGNIKKTPSHLLKQLSNASYITHRKSTAKKDSVWLNTNLTLKTHNKDIIILTDKQSWNDSEESVLMQLARHNRVFWVQIIDSNVYNLPSGQYQMADNQGVKPLHINKHIMEKAKLDFAHQNAQLKEKLSNLGIHYQLFDLSESPEKIARHLLLKGALR